MIWSWVTDPQPQRTVLEGQTCEHFDDCYAADTPGVHLQHSLQHLLPPEQFKELLPRGRLKPFYPPTPQDLALQQQRTSQSHSRCAIQIRLSKVPKMSPD